MIEHEILVDSVYTGGESVDCIFTTLEKNKIQICFPKQDNVFQYTGKKVTLINNNGRYSIKPIQANKAIIKK